MKKIEFEDLKVLETYLKHILKELSDPYKGSAVEAVGYVEDALAEIRRWKENGK